MNTQRELHGRVVRAKIRIQAPPEDVWAAWATPDGIARWFVDRAEGEAVAGGTMTWHFDEMDVHLPVPVAEAEPGRNVVFAGEIPGRLPFVQEVTLEKDGDETVLRLLNSGFAEGDEANEEYEGVESGWALALATLKHHLERYPGRKRVHELVMRPVEYDPAVLQEHFLGRHGLQAWLAENATVSGRCAGRPLSLKLRSGGTLIGEILANSGHEVLFSWPERHGVLGLKGFRAGSSRMVGLDYSGWAGDKVRPELEEALDRLVDVLHAAK